VLSATNRDITEMVALKRFRQDLLSRLNEWHLHLSPLRSRLEDMGLLIACFLEERNAGALSLAFSHVLLERIMLASWPGNIRDLKSAISRLAVSTEHGAHMDDLHLDLNLIENWEKNSPIGETYEPNSVSLSRVLELYEENISGVARYFGKERMQIYRWLEKWGLREAPGNETAE
jgi:DNA-binding NtrC family response regulator